MINTRYIPRRGELLEEFPNEFETDCVVIGGGPNGLIAGAYLSKCRLRVVLCERRYEIGGGLATEEILFPSNYSNVHAVYHMMVDYMPPIRDFNLEEYMLYWIQPNIQTSIIFKDGTSLILGKMLQDSKDSVSKFSVREGEKFEKTMRKWRRFVDEILAPATYYPPLPPADFVECLEKTQIGREFLAIAEKSPLEIIEQEFSEDKLKALLLYKIGMWGVDLEESGMGFMVPLLVVRGSNMYYCYGGSHRFASALAKVISSSGGIILDNAEVERILVEGKKAVGVELRDGRKIFAKAILSSLPAPTTFFELIGQENLPKDIREEILPLKDWKWDKWSFFTTHAVLPRPPEYNADDIWTNQSFMQIIGFDKSEDVIDFFANLREGKISKVGGHITCQTIFDDTLSREGKHIAFFQMCVPYYENWYERKEAFEKDVIKVWKEYSDVEPIFIRSETPLDIQRRLKSMVRGSIKHGDYTPLQMGYFRPLESCSSSRTPVQGLYLCGAGTYPGGLIIGGPGYICANIVADDMGIKKWWSYPKIIERYIKEYIEG